jgi:hypothetical protein
MVSELLLILCSSLLSLPNPSAVLPRANAEVRAAAKLGERVLEVDAIYADLVSRRHLQIARLQAYAADGRFPRNRDFPGQLVPYFVDASDSACAVAHLMRLDGQTAIVKSVAATDNHIRIENVARGPLIDWIRDSGLTQAECALIQPSYATIEDYRQHRPWQDEQQRLRNHFESVEKALHVQSQRSLGEALIAKLSAEQATLPDSPANDVSTLTAALSSPERNVRIAAAHLLATVSSEKAARTPRINALKANLTDPDLAVAFWTAVAVENVGSANRWSQGPNPGAVELHVVTLPVFLAVLCSDLDELRLPALLQLANIAPESISTNCQLRIIPEVRHALVTAGDDRDPAIRSAARRILDSWRWQRTAYESQRMRRHYLADSFDLECLAAETLTLGRSFATPSVAVDKLHDQMSVYDKSVAINFFEPRPDSNSPPTATTFAEASNIVQQHLRSFQKDVPAAEQPKWTVEQVASDPFYFAVRIVYPNERFTHSNAYFVPRTTLFEQLSKSPHAWLETKHGSAYPTYPASPPSTIRPAEDLRIRLAEKVRSDLDKFTAACDLSASFMTYYARIVIDRSTSVSPGSLTWKGRIADIRKRQPRFLQQGGGGSSVFGGGGWDFHQLTLTCDRSTGDLKIDVEPIIYPLKPAPPDVVAPSWTVDELKLMGWKPLRSPDFFGDRLLHREYHEAAEEFDPQASQNAAGKTRSKLYRTWSQDKTLPPPNLMVALLYDRAGDRENAKRCLNSGGGESRYDPNALAEIARWELSIGETDSAQKHAQAAVKLQPNHSVASTILKQIESQN